MTQVPAIIKENGSIQHPDITLTAEIAGALRDMILAGKAVISKKAVTHSLVIGEGESQTTISLSTNTIHAWIKRDNIIPGVNRSLRDYLNEARLEFRTAERERIQQEIIDNAEKSLQALLKMPTKSPMKVLTRYKHSKKSGFYVTSKVEEQIQGHDSKLLEVKARGLMFGLERLDPARYSAKVDVKNTHLVFNLGWLRRVKEGQDELLPA